MYEVHIKTIKRFRPIIKDETAYWRKSKINRCNSSKRKYANYRRKVLAKETTVELLSKALSYFTPEKGIYPVVVYSPCPIDTIDVNDAIVALVDLFKDQNNFPEIETYSNGSFYQFDEIVSEYLKVQLNEDTDVRLQDNSFDLSVKFLNNDLGLFYVIELSEINTFIQQDSLMALVYLKMICSLQEVYALFDFGLGTVDYEETSQLDEMLSEYVYQNEDLTESQQEEEMNKMTSSYWHDYRGYPYHYGKIVSLLDNYNLDFDLFLETFKDVEFRYKELIRLIVEISKVQKLDQFAEEYFDTIPNIKNIDIEVNSYFIVCYKQNWSEFEDITSLDQYTNDMQNNFENCETSGLKINLRLSKTDPFPITVIQDFIKEANEIPYVKLFKQIHDEWNAIFNEKVEVPFTDTIIEDYCKKSNTSIFSWLKSKSSDRADGCLSQWKSFSDFNAEYPGTQRDWPFNERSDEGIK